MSHCLYLVLFLSFTKESAYHAAFKLSDDKLLPVIATCFSLVYQITWNSMYNIKLMFMQKERFKESAWTCDYSQTCRLHTCLCTWYQLHIHICHIICDSGHIYVIVVFVSVLTKLCEFETKEIFALTLYNTRCVDQQVRGPLDLCRISLFGNPC